MEITATEGYRFDSRLFGGQGIFGSLEDLGLADGYFLGKALGAFLAYKHEKIYACLASDKGARAMQLESEVVRGLLECGVRVLAFPSSPTPLVRFAATELNAQLAVSITSESMPAEYNGVKIFLEGFALERERALQIQNIAASGNWRTREGGKIARSDGLDAYATRLFADGAWAGENDEYRYTTRKNPRENPRKNMQSLGHVVLAQSEGGAVAEVMAAIAKRIANVAEKVSVVEGVEAMREAMQATPNGKKLGFLFNRDGTALQVFDSFARAVPCETLFALLLRDAGLVGARKTVLVDSFCSDSTVQELRSIGAQVERRKDFGAELFSKIGRQREVIAAASCDGHIALMDRYYAFEDACYVALRLLAILSRREVADWNSILRSNPEGSEASASRIKRIEVGGGVQGNVQGNVQGKAAAIARLRDWVKTQDALANDGTEGKAETQNSDAEDGDGLEVERRSDSWRWIIRAADFENILLMRSEGDDAVALRLAQDNLNKAMEDCEISDVEAAEAVGFISHL